MKDENPTALASAVGTTLAAIEQLPIKGGHRIFRRIIELCQAWCGTCKTTLAGGMEMPYDEAIALLNDHLEQHANRGDET